MKLKHVILVLILVLSSAVFIPGCMRQEIERPKGPLSVSELFENPAYNTELKIYGEVSLLDNPMGPLFELTSGKVNILVWYDSMIEDDETERPAVSIEGIENGDRVIVTGELKTEGKHTLFNDFWARNIEKIE